MDTAKRTKLAERLQKEFEVRLHGSPGGRIEEEIPGGVWADGTPRLRSERLKKEKNEIDWLRFYAQGDEADPEYRESVAGKVERILKLESSLPKEPPAPPVAPEGSGAAVRAAFASQAGYDSKAVTRELRLEQIEAERSRLKAEEDALQEGALVTREPIEGGE